MVRERLDQLVAIRRGACSAIAAGIGSTRKFAPRRSSSQISARCSTKSITPVNFSSAPIGICNRSGLACNFSLDIGDDALEIRTHPVHLVDERDARHAIFVGLPPHGFGLRLDAADRAEHRDRAVENAQAALDFNREIDVARRIDNIYRDDRARNRWSQPT